MESRSFWIRQRLKFQKRRQPQVGTYDAEKKSFEVTVKGISCKSGIKEVTGSGMEQIKPERSCMA